MGAGLNPGHRTKISHTGRPKTKFFNKRENQQDLLMNKMEEGVRGMYERKELKMTSSQPKARLAMEFMEPDAK